MSNALLLLKIMTLYLQLFFWGLLVFLMFLYAEFFYRPLQVANEELELAGAGIGIRNLAG